MIRDVEKNLKQWMDQENRMPLLIRGARQVGKSYSVEKFGIENFARFVCLNFELQPKLKQCFDSLDPQDIINKVQLLLNVDIKGGDTLLFFDEIQECPRAIMSLRYFKEKMPKLHVIGAGSLLEFSLNEHDFRMPVGRIQFMYMRPLSFGEFCDAMGHNKLRAFLFDVKISDKIDDAIHEKLMELVFEYCHCGGMPAVCEQYAQSKDLRGAQNLQSAILETYRRDFGKYATKANYKYIQKLFDVVPAQVGQRFKYANIDADMRARELKKAFELLSLAGILTPVYHSHASGIPLGAQVSQKAFKTIFLDVGLLQNACGISGESFLTQDFLTVNNGSVAEQFVGQEFLAYSDKHTRADLYFWIRDKKGSSAEVDYVISHGGCVFPIEVKAGKTGTLKSMKLFLAEKNVKVGVRISKHPFSFYDNVLSIPLYMIEQMNRILDEV